MALPTIPEISFKFVGKPDNLNSVLGPDEIKAALDAGPEEVRLAVIALTNALKSVVDGSSGADNIGATAISTSPSNVQGILEWLKDQVDLIVAGGVADESVTDAKLSNTAGQIKERVASHLADDVRHVTAVNRTDWDSVAIRYGKESQLVTTGVSMDTLVDNGLYRGNGLVNAPDADWYLIEVIKHDAAWSYQRVIAFTQTEDGSSRPKIYERVMRGGIWSSWTRVSQVPSATGMFTDSTTQIVALGTYTKIIPLGFGAKFGKLLHITPSSSYWSLINFNTVQSQTKGVGYVYNAAAPYVTPKVDGSLAYAGITSASTCWLQNAYISGTNLVLVYNNADTTTTRTLFTDVLWEVWG